MKIKKVISMMLSVVFVIALCVPVYAVESRASDQIAGYTMKVDPISGAMAVFFSVTGPGYVDKLGCESIYLYKMVDSRWIPVYDETKLENDDGMSKTNAYVHANSILCNSERGVPYKIVVTIFAENSKGRDTRTETFYEVGK